MAKCKNCKTNIPDGTDYCIDCQDKVISKGNESYLDSLLNSVKNSPSVDNIYKKKNNVTESNNPVNNLNQSQNTVNEPVSTTRQRKEPVRITDSDDDDLYRVDFSDIEDFDKYNIDDDFADIESDIIINDEDLFGESLADLMNIDQEDSDEVDLDSEIDHVVESAYIDKQLGDRYADEQQNEMFVEEDTSMDDIDYSMQSSLPTEKEENTLDDAISHNIETEFSKRIDSDVHMQTLEEDPVMQVSTGGDEAKEQDLSYNEQPESNVAGEEYSELSEDTDIDFDLDDLLNSLDAQNLEDTVARSMANPEEDMFTSFGDEDIEELSTNNRAASENKTEFESIEAEHDDFFNLMDQMSNEDPSTEDIKAISDMLANGSGASRRNNMPSDVGEVFSDALKAVSSLDDYEKEEEKILGKVLSDNSKNEKSDKNKLKEKEKKTKEKNTKAKKTKVKPLKEKSGLSLFQRLFGNVKNDKTATQHNEELRAQTEPKAEKVKKVKVKGKKGPAPSEEDEENSGDRKGSQGKADKKESKKEKAEKKKKTKEVIQVIDEIDEDPGRINRLGAFIVFFFFGVIAIILILGTNMVTYTLSIQHATNYFNHRKYTQAYNEVYGVDIKDEDIEMYDKIQTVMFVNKQLNSYNNNYSMKKYPEALDSLLKGLSRYDKYIELATMLGIETDLDYVRSQILAELNNVFHLSEEEAIQILKSSNMEDYSLAVYNVVLEKMNN